MHNKYILILLLTFDAVSIFPYCLKRRLQIHQTYMEIFKSALVYLYHFILITLMKISLCLEKR